MSRSTFQRFVGLLGALTALTTVAAPAQAAQIGAVTDLTWGIPEADVSKTIGLLAHNGVRTVRMNVNWRAIEPNTRGVMETDTLEQIDRTVDALAASGIEILMPISDGVPYWASADPEKQVVDGVRRHNGLYRPTSMQDFADFAAFVARRYSARGVHLFEVWNEPNHPHFWPSGPGPTAYAEMLGVAYPAIKAADPDARVVLGGLSGNAATYLDGLYRAGAGKFFDIAAVHPYVGDVDPTWCWTLPSLTTLAPDAFCGLEEVRSVMKRHGDGAKPLWLTEFGWTTTSAAYGVSEAQQAAYLTAATEKLETYPWVQRAYWYSFRNLPWGRDDASSHNANYGVLRTDFTAKPALAALRVAAVAGGIDATPAPAPAPAHTLEPAPAPTPELTPAPSPAPAPSPSPSPSPVAPAAKLAPAPPPAQTAAPTTATAPKPVGRTRLSLTLRSVVLDARSRVVVSGRLLGPSTGVREVEVRLRRAGGRRTERRSRLRVRAGRFSGRTRAVKSGRWTLVVSARHPVASGSIARTIVVP